MRSDLFQFPPAVDQNLSSLKGKEVKAVIYDAEPEFEGHKAKGFAQGMVLKFTDGTYLIVQAVLMKETLGDAGYPIAYVPAVATFIT